MEEREMAKPLLTDELWLRIEPLLPAPKPRPQGGRPPVPNRAALTGILFVLRTGCPWEYLPQEMGCGSGMTCWRRLRDWHVAGVWRQVWLALLDELGLADEIDWDKVVIDSCSVRALFGGRSPAPIPRIAVKMARSGMLPAMVKGRRWRSSRRAPTSTTANKRSR
jgi:transposase